MDVGDPSNMERLRHFLGDAESLQQTLAVTSVSDADIEITIKRHFKECGFAICPHTATAVHCLNNMADDARDAAEWIVVATAHPAKFEGIVEPLIGETVALPVELQQLLARAASSERIEPDVASLAAALR